MNSLVGRLVKRGVVGAIGQRWEAVTPRPDGSVLVIEIAKRLNDAETMIKPAVRPRGTDGLVPTRVASWFVVPTDGRAGWVLRDSILRKKYRLVAELEVGRERGTEVSD